MISSYRICSVVGDFNDIFGGFQQLFQSPRRFVSAVVASSSAAASAADFCHPLDLLVRGDLFQAQSNALAFTLDTDDAQ